MEELRERIECLEENLQRVADAVNANSEALGLLIMSLGLVIRQNDNGSKKVSVSIPNDPTARHGFIAQIVRDLTEVKKRLPEPSIVIAKNFEGLK